MVRSLASCHAKKEKKKDNKMKKESRRRTLIAKIIRKMSCKFTWLLKLASSECDAASLWGEAGLERA